MRSSRLAATGLMILTMFVCARDGRAEQIAAQPALSSTPSTRRVLFSAGGSVLLGVALPDFTAAGGLALALQEDWSVRDRLRLGLAEAMTVTSLPYGSNDGEPAPLRRTGSYPTSFASDVSFPTRILATVALDLDHVQLDAGLGATFLVSSTMGAFSLFPGLVEQAGVTVPLGAPGTPLSLRLAVWRAAAWGLQPGQSVVVPELSLGIRL